VQDKIPHTAFNLCSALDSESEAVVQEALDAIMAQGNVTVVVIAHRLSTIMNADMIAVVKGGMVVETGTHPELLAKKGQYFELVEAQKGKLPQSGSSSSLATIGGSDNNYSSRTDSAADLQLMEEPDIKTSTDAVIDVHNVHFTYPSRPDSEIFKGLGVNVKEGETLAIVGPSGQGKSTIIQLIEEFYRPSNGKLKYNGDDLVDMNVRWYRNE
jgi:ATP-binding cassette, subfamily B (MDR/TAP), member 1